MVIKNLKNIIIVCLVLCFCSSCTKEKRSEIIKDEIKKDTGVISINDYGNNDIEYKYVINKRTGKVHSYSHGMSVVSDKYRFETNDDGYYYNFDFDGKNIAYTTIIRVRGGD